MGRCPPMTVGVRKLESLGLHDPMFGRFNTISAHDRRTDRQTDAQWLIAALATYLSHAFIHDFNSQILAPALTTEFMSTHQASQILHSNTTKPCDWLQHCTSNTHWHWPALYTLAIKPYNYSTSIIHR